MARVLFIEDEVYVMRGLLFTLQDQHTLTVKTNGADAMAELRSNLDQYDLVILDLMLPRGKPVTLRDKIPDETPAEKVGEYVYESYPKLGESVPVILLTATRATLKGLQNRPKLSLCVKPVRIAELLATIDKLLGMASREKRKAVS